ncbi:sigma-70 family RNA polymerase sigma factor [Acidiphilium iwatense]|uniref:Sigma-70 family RNA polymerase sigma factor n=1 Tax=Acidiphilium iwatense TaxID=768198 RepID=A0ABS9DUC0_9PROT|nr:sigma-70 family RNA polymerase sigma factor [Acidiphilium iwatense]MCF3946322.1 sigma-70 family RNA polymerase sigma factor [Acidiphilium iwatense]
MGEKNWPAELFETHGSRLLAVAYRMLGSAGDAEDAVQETWLRLNRAGPGGVENPGGWLTTVIARVCLDMLRARKSRREEPMDARVPEPVTERRDDPDHDLLLADSVGVALLVVLGRLAPAERVAFVLHDMFDLPFDQIAAIVGRSPEAARQLASRARRRVRGAQAAEDVDRARQRAIVDAFLAAARAGDFAALLAVLDPDVAFRADPVAVRMGGAPEIHGAEAVAKTFKRRAQGARPILVDGAVGLLVAPGGWLRVLLRMTIRGDRIARIEAIADPERLGRIGLTVLGD